MTAKQLKELEFIFNPKSVAVVGSSHSDNFTLALMRTKIKENLFLVNPRYRELLGMRCYASILDIEPQIDYAIIAVPASQVPKVLIECTERGVKTAHIYTAGFSETGLEERAKLENEVKELAKGKLRLIGPNCLGIYCPKSGLSFNPDSSTEEGSLGLISQSGTFATLFITAGKIRNIRFSKAVSYGNALDLDCPDFLDYMADDPQTKVIALYMEGTKDGNRLKSALDRAAGKKPVIALKGGVTRHGSRAASSHTGSLAGSPETWGSLFKQTGVVQVDSFVELVDAVLAISYSPLPCGKGVSLITSSGGFSVIETDLCVKAGLEVPQFGEKTIRELRKIVPAAGTSVKNPLDAWPTYYNLSRTSRNLCDAIKTVGLDQNIHALVFHFDELKFLKRVWGGAFEGHLEELVDVIINGCACVRDEIRKPVMICVPLDAYSEDEEDRRHHLLVKKAFESRQFPVYSSLDASIKALSNLYKHGTQFNGKYPHH